MMFFSLKCFISYLSYIDSNNFVLLFSGDNMSRKITNAAVIAFTLFWVIFIFFDYIDKHPYHIKAFESFKYFNLFLIFQLLGLFLFVGVQFVNVDKIKRKFYTGFSLLGINILICLSIIHAFDDYIGLETSFKGSLYFIGRIVSYVGVILSMFTAVYVLGKESLIRFFGKGNSFSLCLAIGLVVFILLLFCIGAIHQLTIIPLTLLIAIPIVVFYKQSFGFLKTVLFTPFKDYKQVNYWGYIAFYILIIALGINLLSVLSPYPYGFDARNYYLNVTQLISQNHGLVTGFQPYNWQLFMSSGFIILDSHEMAILLSFSAFILSLIAINEFSRKIFKLDINYRFLLMCIFTVTPAIYNQLSIDVKIDFALLFFQIVIVHQFFKYLGEEDPKISFLVLISLLSGFALGIKFTHLYLIATLVIVYWSVKAGAIGLLASSSISIGVFLIAKIDEVGGLRQAHLGVDFVQWIIAGIGIGLVIYFFFTQRQKLLKIVKFSLLFAVLTSLPVMPWVAKNFVETKSLSPKTLLMGEQPGFKTSFRKMDALYKKTISE